MLGDVWVGGSKSYYSPSRAYWKVCMLVAIGHTAVLVGHTGWQMLVAVGHTAVLGRSYWGVCMLVDTAVPVGHTEWWMLVAVVRTTGPRGGCIGVVVYGKPPKKSLQ